MNHEFDFPPFDETPSENQIRDHVEGIITALLEGKLNFVDARNIITSIKHPGIRLRVDNEFRNNLSRRIRSVHGVDKFSDYVQSLRILQSKFGAE